MHILGKVAQFELRTLDLESKDGYECWLLLDDTGHVPDILRSISSRAKQGWGHSFLLRLFQGIIRGGAL